MNITPTLGSKEQTEPLLLTVQEAAKLTRISRSKIYEMLLRKEIPSITIGRSRRIPMDGLKKWIASMEAAQASIAPSSGYH